MLPQSPQAGSAWNRIRPQHGEAALGLALQQSRTGLVEDDRGLLRSALNIICLTAIWTLQCLQSTWEWNLLHIHHPQDSYGPHLGMLEGMGMERKDLKRQVCSVVPLPNCPPWQEQPSGSRRSSAKYGAFLCWKALGPKTGGPHMFGPNMSKLYHDYHALAPNWELMRGPNHWIPLMPTWIVLYPSVSNIPEQSIGFPHGQARTMFTLLQDNVCVNGCNTVVITCPSPC